MARLRPLTKEEVSPEVRPLLESGEKVFGAPLVSSGIKAYVPVILEASNAIGSAPARSHTLHGQLRSLMCLRAAQMAGCPF